MVTDQPSVRVFYWLPGWMWREGNKNKNTTQASATIRVLFSFSLFKNVILFAKFCLVFCMSCFCVWDIIQILNPTTRPFDRVWQGVSCCLDDSQDVGIWGESHCIGGSSAGLWYQHWLLLFYYHCFVLLLVLNDTPSLWGFDTNTDYSTTALWEDDDINTSVAIILASGLRWLCWIRNRNCHQFKCNASADLRNIHCKSLTFVKKHVAMFFLKCQMQGHHQSGCSSYIFSGSCPLALSSAHLHSLESWQHQTPSHQ